MKTIENTAEKFWAQVEKTDTCWIWNGTIDNVAGGTYSVQQKAIQQLLYVK